ncbi:putative camphor resistance protein CrcB2 [Bifidobacterium actinocoloniiforme DSM 22766]|uniref:Fluoride-specific ion channel FluC n=1 Tax=Bifidobacterium actinocoloniiforme DSM 22766 TaxID=1437605 RepID=A0A086Z004_9BIFI|nr:CrcB family protein [Bifidobacterium actinocoloniiforme]AKV55124.1 hypothetical protein AB656_01375 [Bifidobacterium actinocoloniiforme DSM 22766]KFI39854.1 putative camphor resistance protein CrcB2 [Bifidobacterium actinocoloniiforme DSM 22766]
MTVLLVCLGGGVGAGARYLLDTAIKRSSHGPFPWSTLVINLIASCFAGLVAAFSSRLLLDPTAHLLLATGLLGGFSTFSTAIADTLSLTRTHRFGQAGLSLLTSMIAPLLAVAGGFAVGMAL